jgi:hypothetical protein
MPTRHNRETQEVALGPPEATPIPLIRWGSRQGGRCGAAPSTGAGWLKRADPDVGNTGNGHRSDGDDDNDQNEPKTDGRDKHQQRDATGGRTQPQGRQEAGGRDGSDSVYRGTPHRMHATGGSDDSKIVVGPSSFLSIIYFAFLTYFLCI